MELPLYVWGLFGACGPEAYRWYLSREHPLPPWAKELKYWLITTVMIAFGPILVFMYEASGATPARPDGIGECPRTPRVTDRSSAQQGAWGRMPSVVENLAATKAGPGQRWVRPTA